MARWIFPYDTVLHPDDDYMRQAHTRADTCACYEQKCELAKRAFRLRPSTNCRVLEIGVRACYSAEAFCAAGASHFLGIDLDAFVWGGMPGWVQPSFAALATRWPQVDARLHVGDSHSIAAREAASAYGPYALIHVDGDHSFDGALADLENYSGLLDRRGLLVVDGLHWDEPVWDASQEFVRRHDDWQLDVVHTFGFGDDAILSRTAKASRAIRDRSLHWKERGLDPNARR
jgi:hypothetical protein